MGLLGELRFPLSKDECEKVIEYLAKPNPKDKYYIMSYPDIIKGMAGLNRKESWSDTVAAVLAYGWMPTGIDSQNLLAWRGNRSSLLYEIDQLAAYDEVITFLERHNKAPINNSWVGSSKFLHFLSPTLFPIWDSNIAKKLGTSTHSLNTSANFYREYVKSAWRWRRDVQAYKSRLSEVFAKLKNDRADTIYEVSEIRTVESLLFFSSRIKGNSSQGRGHALRHPHVQD